MDFGAILDTWEKSNSGSAAPDRGQAALPLREFGRGAERGRLRAMQDRRRRLRNKKPDAQLDLHGKSRDEARLALEDFFEASKDQGLEKVLVIHGKGNHSEGDAALRRVVSDFIERCPYAGESGRGKAASGGDGVTWVLLKEAQAEGGFRPFG
jgi:DNA-nicking Smr family endonuclease